MNAVACLGRRRPLPSPLCARWAVRRRSRAPHLWFGPIRACPSTNGSLGGPNVEGLSPPST